MPNEDTGLQTDELASILEDGGDEAEVETQVEVEDPEPEDINHQVSLSQGEDELDEEVEEKDTPEKDDSGEEKDDEIIEEDGEGKDKLDAQIPHYQEIKAKYPTLFKDFPGLKASFFFSRDVQEIFGNSIDNVKHAAADLIGYQKLEASILEGKAEVLLGELHKNKKDEFIDEFLPSLAKIDKDAFIRVTEPVIGNLLRQVIAEGTRRGGDAGKNLIAAAKVISNEAFGTYDVPKFERKAPPEPTARERELEEQVNQSRAQAHEKFGIEVNELGDKYVIQAIEKLLPKGVTDYQRKVLIKEIKSDLEDTVKKDQKFMASLRPLWQGAVRNNYAGDSKANIVKAVLARAKQSLPGIAKKHISEFSGKRQVKTPDKNNRGEGPAGTSKPTGIRPIPSGKQIDTRKTSSMDILNDKITLKG
jgi:hypothetical protein